MSTPAPTTAPRRGIRFIAAALAALVAAATLSLTAVAPPAAAAPAPQLSHDLIVGQDVGFIEFAAKDTYTGSGWQGDSYIPPGLARDMTAELGFGLVGTPTKGGIYTLRIEIQSERGGPWVPYTITFRIHDDPVWTTSPSLPAAQVGVPFSVQLGVEPFADSFTALGDLPSGLTLTPQGLLSGTPTASSLYTFHINATNRAGITPRIFTLLVAPPPTPAPVWQTTSLPTPWAGQPYVATLSASNATSYVVTDGTLPPGLTLTPNGVISGTPTNPGTSSAPYSFTVRATGLGGSTTQAFDGGVRPNPPGWVTSSIGPMQLGVPFDVQLEADYTSGFVLFSGSLPPGISLERDGRVHGTPTETGDWSATINAGNSSFGAQKTFDITVNPPAPAWQTASLGELRRSTRVSITLEATGATSFAVTAGALPAGLTLADGRITGQPTQLGAYDVTITATNTYGSTPKRFTGSVGPYDVVGEPVWQTDESDFPELRVGLPFSLKLEAERAVDYELSAGILPDGVTLVGDTLSGTPTLARDFAFEIIAYSATGEHSARTFRVDVLPPLATWVTESIGPLEVGTYQSIDIDADGASLFKVVAGALPAGISLAGSGVIMGTPSAAGSFPVTIAALNPADEPTTRVFTIVVELPPLPQFTTTSLDDVTLDGSEAEWWLTIEDADTVKLVEGELPPGFVHSLKFQRIWGTPDRLGSYTFTLEATNESGSTKQQFTARITDGDGVWFTESVGPFGVSVPVDVQLGANAESYELAMGSLPAGLELSADGRLTGTPSTASDVIAVIRAVTAGGIGYVRTFDVTVDPRPVWVGTTSVRLALGAERTLSWTDLLEVSRSTRIAAVTPSADAPFTATLTDRGHIDLSADRVGSGSLDVDYSNGHETLTKTIDIDVYGAPAWATTSLGDLEVGVAVERGLQAADASSFSITAGALPAGLELSDDGELTGTPSAHGDYDVTITATNDAATAPQRFTGTVAAGTVSWVTADVGPFVVGDAVDVQLEATNAATYVQWGAGVPGLTLESNGRLHGTVTQTGTFSLSVEGVNADGIGSTKGFLATVRAVPVWAGESAYTVTAGEYIDLPNASVTGGSMKSVSVAPAGVATAEVRGRFGLRITGVAEGTATVSVILSNGSRDYPQELELEVLPRPVWVTESLGELHIGGSVELQLEAADASGFSVVDGELPAGLTLTPDGKIAGTPTTRGSYDVTLAASNGDIEVEQQFTGTVAAGEVAWGTTKIGPFTVGEPVDVQFDAEYAESYIISRGALPDGLVLEPSGRLHGTPTAKVTSREVGIRGLNADGDGATLIAFVSVYDASVWMGETSYVLTTGTGLRVPGTALNTGIMTEAAVSPSGIVDAEALRRGGLQLDALAPGTATVTVTFNNGARDFAQDLTVVVRDAPVWVSDELGELREGVAFQQTFEATDATGFAVTAGALPAGLSLVDGVLSGTPATFGPYDFTVAATNGATEIEQRFTGQIAAPLVEWVTEALPGLDRNVPADLPLEAPNAVAFEVTDGELPPGIELVQRDTDASGRASVPVWALVGTPSEAGTFAFELTARNATDETEPRSFELVVEQPELMLALDAEPGDEASGLGVEATGSGLAPSSSWDLVLHSDPVVIAAGEASADGLIAASATLSANVPFGAHELRLSATGADGVEVTTSVWFSVGEDGRIVEVSTTGPVAEPSRAPVPTPAPAPAADDAREIADTGVEVSGWFGGALAVLALGFVVLLGARRRRLAD